MGSAEAYERLERVLRQAGLGTGLADAHGVLAGLLCADAEAAWGRWRRHLRAEGLGGGVPEAELRALHDAAAAALAEETGFGFTPLLPPDEAPLARRVAALGAWCQGFLFGLGAAGAGEVEDEAAAEALRDLWQIAQVSDEVAADEADEAAYAELVEFLRVAVQLVREALRARGRGDGPA
ncbi:UPF0149 family protein [Inmirania thermothiophila]|uniref:YecA family protein n=1 Tax=Inmirania thermothiophila TaxID=1750597 RepID=A0A3N1Y729_9GAMM|nr:UPF0149 family protein [Inmirania thermothiophila]ROR34634.1 hypothetical protein EDC57_0535 [Inmirania thermothiophila]